MWQGDESAFVGRHYRLDRPLSSPQSVTRPHPPMVIGGSGERNTLRLVPRFADACSLLPTPDLPHNLEIVKAHRDAEGRDYAAIEKTSMYTFDASTGEAGIQPGILDLRWMGGVGIQTVYLRVVDAYRLTPLEGIAERIVPAVADL